MAGDPSVQSELHIRGGTGH